MIQSLGLTVGGSVAVLNIVKQLLLETSPYQTYNHLYGLLVEATKVSGKRALDLLVACLFGPSDA